MLKDPRWQKKRLEVMQRDGFRCQHCLSEDKELQVHHAVYHKNYKPWEYENKELITLCRRCHEIETEEKAKSYEIFKELKTIFEESGYSFELLNSILSKLCSVAEYGSVDEDIDDPTLIKFFEDCIYGTQNYSDIVLAGQRGLNMRDLVQHNFPNMLKEYDKEVEYGKAD